MPFPRNGLFEILLNLMLGGMFVQGIALHNEGFNMNFELYYKNINSSEGAKVSRHKKTF
jgi:hypothetical protein